MLGGVTPREWDRLAANAFYSSSTWLRHCATYPGAVSDAVVARGAGDHLAAVPVADLTRPPSANYQWAKIVASRGLPSPPVEGTLVGPRLGYQSSVLADTDDPALLGQLVALLRERHRSTGSVDDRALVAMYLSTRDVTRLREVGVETLPVLLEPDAWIHVPDGGWDAWLARLPSRRRIHVKREVRRFDEAGCRISHVDLVDCHDRLPPLAESMALKYGYPGRAADFAEEFAAYARSTGALARVALCERDGDLTGFCIYYVWGDTVYLRWASFDYAKLTGSQEYFNLSYYSQVRVAADVDAHWLHAGKNAIRAKVLRGAELRPLWLLDLAEDSKLLGCDAEIRHHNATVLATIRADPLNRDAIREPDEWAIYC